MDRRELFKLSASSLLVPALIENASPVAQAQPLETLTKPWAPRHTVWSLPESPARRLAWTVDDGGSLQSLRSYTDLLKRHPDLRMTFFVTSAYSTWRSIHRYLQPLVDTGQVQLANHTHTHADLTHLSASQIGHELNTCRHFIYEYYGVKSQPFFRPPFGYYNDYVIRSAAAVGYYTPVMWYGTLGDSGSITGHRVVELAKAYFHDEALIIGHSNNMTASSRFDDLLKLIRNRALKTVTLNDVWRS